MNVGDILGPDILSKPVSWFEIWFENFHFMWCKEEDSSQKQSVNWHWLQWIHICKQTQSPVWTDPQLPVGTTSSMGYIWAHSESVGITAELEAVPEYWLLATVRGRNSKIGKRSLVCDSSRQLWLFLSRCFLKCVFYLWAPRLFYSIVSTGYFQALCAWCPS